MNTKELDGYLKFLSEKQTAVQESGFDVDDSDLSPQLFPFQKYCVKRALKVGRFGVGFELKDSYFNEAVKNCKAAEADTNAPKLFDM